MGLGRALPALGAIAACNAAFGVDDLAYDAATSGSAGQPSGGGNAGGIGGDGGEGGRGGGGEGGAGGGAGGAAGAGGGTPCHSCSAVLEDLAIELTRVPHVCGYISFAPPNLQCELFSSCSLLGALITCACQTSCGASCDGAGCQGGPIGSACQACIAASCTAELDACNSDI